MKTPPDEVNSTPSTQDRWAPPPPPSLADISDPLAPGGHLAEAENAPKFVVLWDQTLGHFRPRQGLRKGCEHPAPRQRGGSVYLCLCACDHREATLTITTEIRGVQIHRQGFVCAPAYMVFYGYAYFSRNICLRTIPTACHLPFRYNTYVYNSIFLDRSKNGRRRDCR